MNCLNSNLLTALSAVLITSALSDFNTIRLEVDLKAAQGDLKAFYSKSIAEALEAKKQALVAQEDAKKKSGCP